MRTLIITIALLLAVATTPQKTFANDLTTTAGASARLEIPIENIKGLDLRAQALKNVLEKYKSPLADSADEFVSYADKYFIDWRLLSAISGVESTFGHSMIDGSHNAYGWGGGRIYFTSCEDGINKISKSLRENYYERGADTVYKIGPIYAANPHWAARVSVYMDEIDREYFELNTKQLASL